VHLGKLARYLRFCGFDSIYRNDLDDREIVDTAEKDARTILTRDLDLLKNKRITRGYLVRSDDPAMQLKEVIKRLDLMGSITLFTRCMECNGEIKRVPKEDILDRLEPKTRLYFYTFGRCSGCDRIYWKGSHYKNMLTLLNSLSLQDDGH